jgi:hypothetical protein
MTPHPPTLTHQATPTVGFCFSFPMEQLALNSAKLVLWTKGFDVDGVMGKDVVALLSGAGVLVWRPRGRSGGSLVAAAAPPQRGGLRPPERRPAPFSNPPPARPVPSPRRAHQGGHPLARGRHYQRQVGVS